MKANMHYIRFLKVFLCFSVFTSCQEHKELSFIKDPALRSIVADNIKDFFGNDGSYEDLKVISITGNLFRQVHSLDGLQKLKNLKSIGIERIAVTDFSVLKELTKIENISIFENKVQDISFVRNMPMLKQVWFRDTNIQSIEDLRYAKELTRVLIDHNEIVDASPLSDCPSIEYLSAGYNNITVMPDFSQLTKLKIAGFNSNSIADPGNIYKAEALEILNLASNRIASIEWLYPVIEHCKSIEVIYLEDNKITESDLRSAPHFIPDSILITFKRLTTEENHAWVEKKYGKP